MVRIHQLFGTLRRKWEQARRLPANVWRKLPAAYWWLSLAALGLRAVGYGRTERLFDSPVCSCPGEREPVEAVARAVDIASRHHPLPMPCLARSLALARMLRQAGYEAEIKLGVQHAGGRLHGHAWVVVADRPVGESELVTRRFQQLEAADLIALRSADDSRAPSPSNMPSLACRLEEHDGCRHSGVE